MKKKIIYICFILTIVIGYLIYNFLLNSKEKNSSFPKIVVNTSNGYTNPLQIKEMRNKSYPGSDITIEKILEDGSNFHQYIVSYKSEGNKIFALLTVPIGQKPKDGWPVIIFNHGYINPSQYQTFPLVGQYASYYPPLSRDGYIVLKPDYRGNGVSQGQPEGAYYSPAYATDVLNALSSIKKFKDVNPDKIGMWGHSMGGNITLRDIVVNTKDIKVAVIWGGVVGSYLDLQNWHDPNYHPSAYELSLRNRYRSSLQQKYGTPKINPDFWNSVDPTFFLKDIITPLQLHVGGSDEEVPPIFSENLYNKLKSLNKTVELYSYPDDNHNISNNFSTAMQRTLNFFDKYLK